MSVGYAREDEDVDGIDVNDPLILEDFSEVETSDVMEKAPRVLWIIKKAEVRTQRLDNKAPASDDNPWTIKRLSLQVAVGPDGTDNESGVNANRRVFMDYILAFNTDADQRYASDWWQKKARGPAKELFIALGYDVKALPRIDREFLDDLNGREFVADLIKREQEDKTDELNDKGKPIYKKNGTYRNELANHRAAN